VKHLTEALWCHLCKWEGGGEGGGAHHVLWWWRPVEEVVADNGGDWGTSVWRGRRGSPGDAVSRMGSPGQRGEQSGGRRRRSDSRAADTIGPSGSWAVRANGTVGQAAAVQGWRWHRCEEGGEEQRCKTAGGTAARAERRRTEEV
jgi:hypothetical protein